MDDRIIACASTRSTVNLITLGRSVSEPSPSVVYLISHVLREFANAELGGLIHQVEKSWGSLPDPPPGISNYEVVVMLLCSWGYSINTTTFGWDNATEETYATLWRLIERIANQSVCTEVSNNIVGRSGSGYLSIRGLSGVALPVFRKVSGATCPAVSRIRDIVNRARTQRRSLSTGDIECSVGLDEFADFDSDSESDGSGTHSVTSASEEVYVPVVPVDDEGRPLFRQIQVCHVTKTIEEMEIDLIVKSTSSKFFEYSENRKFARR
jgi:hypothetical protein